MSEALRLQGPSRMAEAPGSRTQPPRKRGERPILKTGRATGPRSLPKPSYRIAVTTLRGRTRPTSRFRAGRRRRPSAGATRAPDRPDVARRACKPGTSVVHLTQVGRVERAARQHDDRRTLRLVNVVWLERAFGWCSREDNDGVGPLQGDRRRTRSDRQTAGVPEGRPARQGRTHVCGCEPAGRLADGNWTAFRREKVSRPPGAVGFSFRRAELLQLSAPWPIPPA
jgi:hypothetical protein